MKTHCILNFFRSSPPGSHKEGQRICPVGTEGRTEGARGPVDRISCAKRGSRGSS